MQAGLKGMTTTELLSKPEIQAFRTFQEQAITDPKGFVIDYFGFKPWTAEEGKVSQQTMFDALLMSSDTFLAQANGTGKTSVAVATAITEYIADYPNKTIIVMGAGFGGIAATFWAEMHRRLTYANNQLQGKLYEWFGVPNLVKWYHPEIPWAYMEGFSPKTTGAGQGRKAAGGIILIVEEAVDEKDDALANARWTAIDGLMSTGGKMWLLANPLNRECKAYYTYWNKPSINCLSLSAMDHPNVRFNRYPGDKGYIKGAVDWIYINRIKNKCIGEMNERDYTQHPTWQSRILGQWPETGYEEVVALYSWLDAADKREPVASDKPLRGGIDAAREGKDCIAASAWVGEHLLGMQKWVGKYDTIAAVDLIEGFLYKHGLEKGKHTLTVDLGGNPGICDELSRRGWIVSGIHFNDKPNNDKDYNMKVAEMACHLRDGYKDGLISHSKDIEGCFMSDYRKGCQRKIHKTQGGDGKNALESKEEFKKRNSGESPDIWDAAIMGYEIQPPRLLAVSWV
jgi:hypothetical protein